MSGPLHARDIPGKGRYYTGCQAGCPLGESLYISITNAQSVVAKPALVPAAVKVTAEVAWEYLPHMVRLSRDPADGPCAKRRVIERCGSCRFCLTSAIKAAHRNQWDRAADFGSLVHTHAYARNIGQPMAPDPDVAPFVDQYSRFLNDFGVNLETDLEAAETTIYDPRNGYAGTGDIWLQLPGFGPRGGKGLVLVDIKTSLAKPANAVYPDQVLQLAGLRFAPTAVLPDDSTTQVPKFHAAALLNLRANDYRLITLPADKAAHKAFLNAVGLQRFMHAVDTKTWDHVPAPAATTRKAS